MSTFNLDSYLSELEKTAGVQTDENINVAPQNPDREKVAEAIEEGQIMAHAFYEELEKIAVGDSPVTPNTGAVKDRDKINHVDTGEIKQEEVDKVNAILAQLYGPVRAGVGEIATPAGVVDVPGRPPVDEKPLPADAMKQQAQQVAVAQEMNKAAANEILTNLYNRYFGEE
jgi:hypothetical protein